MQTHAAAVTMIHFETPRITSARSENFMAASTTTSDVTAPVLKSLDIPKTLDLSNGAAQFTISASASDDLSGIRSIYVWFDRDFAYSVSLGETSFSNTSLLGLYGFSDSWEDGASKSAWAIAATNPSGSYNVARVEVVDQQGNTRTYYQSELKALGINTSIEFKGSTPDVTAPTLTSLVIPSTVDLSKGTGQLSIAATAMDDSAGVKQMYVWFDRDFAYSVSLGETSFSNTSLLGLYGFSDSWDDGASKSAWAIAATNPSGSYNVARVEVVDQQGNTRTYYQSELKALGINTAIEFKGSTPDVTAPTLTSLIIPSTVDLSKGTGQLSIAATATDDSAGVKQMYVWFDRDFAYSVSLGETSFSNTSLLGLYGFSDSWHDGASKSAWAIAATNQSGSYNVARVEVVDQQGNTRTYFQSELKELGFNTAINFSKGPVAPQPDPVKVIQGTEASEILYAGDGHDVIDGAGGLDTVVLRGNRADYVVVKKADFSYELQTLQGYTGDLAHVERLHFGDAYVALDLLPQQAAGQTALLIGSLLGSSAVQDGSLFGEVLTFVDANGSEAATGLLVQSGIVASLAGGTGDQELFALLWRNLLGAEGPQQEIDSLVQAKQELGLDQAEVLDFFLQLELTATSIGLVGLAQQGVEYVV